jgi:hypothetical protein
MIAVTVFNPEESAITLMVKKEGHIAELFLERLDQSVARGVIVTHLDRGILRSADFPRPQGST